MRIPKFGVIRPAGYVKFTLSRAAGRGGSYVSGAEVADRNSDKLKGAVNQCGLYQAAVTTRIRRKEKKMVSLSDGEWKIMNMLWERGGSTITELTASLREDTGWDKHIIITMLNRMEKKRTIAHQQGGRAKIFYPAVSREEVSMQETRGFLEKVYRGSLGMMVNAMVEDQALSEEDIQELYDILEQARKKM